MYRKYFQFSVQFTKKFIPSKNSTILNVNNDYLPKRWAGHSKWQNIKSTKMEADRNKSIAFQKLSRLIVSAIKQGGSDPNGNHKLKGLLEEAKKTNMPKATIEKIMKGAQTQSLERPYWAVFSGPKGVVLGLEVTFANSKPSFLVTKLSHQTKKLKLKMEPHFSHLCDERGIIIADHPEDTKNPLEKALDDAIEIGIDEVHENDGKSLIFECIPDRLDSYSQQLMKKGYNVQSSTTELDFKELVNLQEEEINDIDKIITALQNQYEEVIRGIYNVQQ